jgi:hypothetical protein
MDSMKRAQEFCPSILKFIDLLAQLMGDLKQGPVQGLPFIPLWIAII